MDNNISVFGKRLYGSTSIWYSNFCAIDNIENDIFGGSGTNVMASWIFNGYIEGYSHSQSDG